MARIHDLLRSVAASNEGLADEIRREIDATYGRRRAFGLNFERHTPEAVELPGRAVRKGDKVHVLPPRGEAVKSENKVLWFVESIDRKKSPETAELVRQVDETETERQSVDVDDLVVVAEFRDPIYPGLESTGKVERGGDKPYHSVINAENFHALQALMFTHRGKVDAIYIDPPYNTGAKDWKYNNDYVEADDAYRHSKWLAFIERRLQLAKELLNPNDSVLIVAIDEKEYLRLGLLLEQTFPEADIQMISTVINPAGSSRAGRFARTDEYLYFLMFGEATIEPWSTDMMRDAEGSKLTSVHWNSLIRNGEGSRRSRIPSLFYPIFINASDGTFHSVGSSLPASLSIDSVVVPDGTIAIFPIDGKGQELMWRLSQPTFIDYLSKGYLKFGKRNLETGNRSPQYLQSGTIKKVESGTITISGKDAEGALILQYPEGSKTFNPLTIWSRASHSAGHYGSAILKQLIPGRNFPFPKSPYAVEDSLRFVVAEKPEAVVVDFFSGSGTTAHAVMRLNKQDGGRRISISVTNNEVSADEQKDLRARNLRPGEDEWEKWGICDYITKPRIEAVVTGNTPEGNKIVGEYKFTDEFSMSDGFEENVEFFTLTYESQLAVSQGLVFDRIAPLLWVRAGQVGRRIESLDAGFDVADVYGVIADLDKTEAFVSAVTNNENVRVVYVVTEEDRLFETVAQALPANVEVVRLYDDYFRNFEIDAMTVDR